MEILDLIRVVIEKNASDLHLTVGLPLMMRIHGKLRPVKYIKSSGCAGWMNWTGCYNSCCSNNENDNVVNKYRG